MNRTSHTWLLRLAGATKIAEASARLLKAAHKGDALAAKDAIASGANPNTVNSENESPAILAAAGGYVDALRIVSSNNLRDECHRVAIIYLPSS